MKPSSLIRIAAACALIAVAACQKSDVSAARLDARPYGTWGFDLAGRNTAVSPGEDFYMHAVGTAHDRLVIPPDRSGWGSFYELVELSSARGRALIENAARAVRPRPEARKVGDFYKSFMDEARIETLDAAPLEPALAAVRAADTHAKMAALMGKVPSTYHGAFFAPFIGTDDNDPNRYAVFLTQAGLGLPDRDYYLKAEFAEKKAAYRDYVARTLRAVNWPNADAAADAILALETQIAQVSLSKEAQRDPVAMYNAMSPAELAALAPGFDWAAYLQAADLGGVRRLVVREKTAIPQIAALFARTDLPTLQAWQAFTTVDSASPHLSRRFVDSHWAFRAKTLTGAEQQRERWKRGVAAVESALGEAVGKLYVAEYFPPSYKREMDILVANLKAAMKHRIETNDWMEPATKQAALIKLEKMRPKIGYPSKWRDYSPLKVDANDLVGNMLRSYAYEWDYQVGRLNDPVDKEEWYMTPQTVNAYYSGTENEIGFPAAFLQPPNFDPKADPAVNYGGIGATIGHEIIHGFDDEGRQYDASGRLQDWWTPGDAERFKQRAAVLGAQFDAIQPFPGMRVNGNLTMGENIADLGGLIIAYEAYKRALGGKEAPVLDGLTGDQRFFLAYAQSWLTKKREDALRQQIVADPHAPEIYRANVPVANMVEFQRAFGVKPGDKMYVAPDKMARLW